VSRILVNLSVTLDGVLQAPGRADEDPRGGFAHGGWGVPYFHPMMFSANAAASASGSPALLFGRRTYEDFFAVWPKRKDNPFTAVLDNSVKYVASRTLAEPLPWKNSRLLAGDAVPAVAALKKRDESDLVVLGSGLLVRALLAAGLVDDLVLLIHPLVLGTGQRLFAGGEPASHWALDEAKATPTGVVIARYRPAASAEA